MQCVMEGSAGHRCVARYEAVSGGCGRGCDVDTSGGGGVDGDGGTGSSCFDGALNWPG